MERSDTFESLVAVSQQYLAACQDRLKKEFELARWPRYDWSQDTAQLFFSDAGRPVLIADIQFTGSISTLSNTWLWSWANDTIDYRLSQGLAHVREYGTEHALPHLTTAKWHAHEVDGWEMTAIAAYLLKAMGAYRTPDEDGFTFMVFTSIRWAS